jgi:hypothetical protein
MSDGPKASRLYLHIGGEKTGSTTLQLFAGANRAALRQAGVLYPESRGVRVHAGLPTYGAATARNHLASRLFDLDGKEGIEGFRKSFAADLREQVFGSGCQTVWLSNERLSSTVRTAAGIGRLAELMHALAGEVKVVIYLRDQPDLFLSAYSNAIKAGMAADLLPPRSPHRYYYNYETMIDNWAAGFGKEAIIARVFDRKQLKNGDIVSDFLELIGLGDGAQFKRIGDRGARLDGPGMQFLRLFNQTVGRVDGEKLNPDRGRIVKALVEQSGGEKFTLPRAVMEQLRDLFAESNANVARRYMGRADGVLFTPVAYDDTPMAELTVAQAVEIAAKAWAWQQRRNRAGVGGPGREKSVEDAAEEDDDAGDE